MSGKEIFSVKYIWSGKEMFLNEKMSEEGNVPVRRVSEAEHGQSGRRVPRGMGYERGNIRGGRRSEKEKGSRWEEVR